MIYDIKMETAEGTEIVRLEQQKADFSLLRDTAASMCKGISFLEPSVKVTFTFEALTG